MNSTSIKSSTPPLTPECGDIYMGEVDEYYILSLVAADSKSNLLFACIHLNDGNRFRDPNADIKIAVTGLTFVGRNAEISIKFPK